MTWRLQIWVILSPWRQVDVTNRSMNVDLSNYVDNGEWELIDVRTVRRVITYACCPEPFPDVTFYLHMRRRTTYYTFNIIVPCTILSMLTIAGFFLPAESGEKVRRNRQVDSSGTVEFAKTKFLNQSSSQLSCCDSRPRFFIKETMTKYNSFHAGFSVQDH